MENNLESACENSTFYPRGGGKPLKKFQRVAKVVEFHFR